MVRLLGLEPPDVLANSGWGDPVMQVIHDAVSSAGTVTQSIATLISEAKVDVIKIPGMTEIMSTDEGTNRLIKRFSEANVAKSVVNALIIDKEEDWQRIGTLRFTEAICSYNGDHVIQFHHPRWRDDRNDPATYIRVNEERVRR